MKLSFMIKTDDVTNNRATAPNKSVEEMYPLIKEAGYDGVEIMMANPLNIDFAKLQRLSKEYDLPVCALCTGEVYGTEKLSFADPNEKKREEAIRRVKHAMEAAKEFKVPVNIGRVKGMFLDALPPAETIRYSSEGLIACADSNPDVDLILEACCRKFSNFIRSTDEALALIREIGRPNIKMMVDNDI